MSVQLKNQPSVSQYINDTSKEYALYVCSSRAIPFVTDGLKDSTRKALYLMRNKTEKIKTVSLAGEMISSGLYLHGDASASGAASLLAAPYVNNIPLLEGIGAFGTRVAPVEGIAAPRYTYLKKSKAAEELLYRDMDIVPMKPNYDGSTMEPEHFLPLIPLILLNGVTGIAVGWSTNILPRDLKQIIAATKAALNGGKIPQLVPHYAYLDVKASHLEDNVWEFEGKAEVVDASTVLITELPPDTNLEAFKKRLNKMEEEGSIHTYTDNSTDTINVTVKFKRGTVKNWTSEKAISFFKLRERKTERIVVIDWNGSSIRQYESAEDLVRDFAEWRLGWYTKRYEKLLSDDEYEIKYWKGIKACFAKKLPERLLKKANKAEVVEEVTTITKTIGCDGKQIEKIVNLPTYRWVAEFLKEVEDRIKNLEETIQLYKDTLQSPEALKAIYLSELDDLKKVK